MKHLFLLGLAAVLFSCGGSTESTEVQSQIEETVTDVTEAAETTMEDAGEVIEEGVDAVEEAVEGAVEEMGEAAEEGADKVEEMMDDAEEAVK